jgi:hypothetical protein
MVHLKVMITAAHLIEAAGLDTTDTLRGTALGLAPVQDLALGTSRVAGEHGRGCLDLILAEIGADHALAHAGQQREGGPAVNE